MSKERILIGGVIMIEKIKEISSWLLDQGIGITGDVLNEKLEEAYKQGKLDGYHEQGDATLNNIAGNIMLYIDKKKKVLFEKILIYFHLKRMLPK